MFVLSEPVFSLEELTEGLNISFSEAENTIRKLEKLSVFEESKSRWVKDWVKDALPPCIKTSQRIWECSMSHRLAEQLHQHIQNRTLNKDV